jgi:hypothetical protein
MRETPSSANQSVLSLSQLSLMGCSRFFLDQERHIRALRLLATGFLLLGVLLITNAVACEYWHPTY